jgi:hypothetical protein
VEVLVVPHRRDPQERTSATRRTHTTAHTTAHAGLGECVSACVVRWCVCGGVCAVVCTGGAWARIRA